MPDSFYAKYGKRIFDFIISLICLSLLSPVFFIIVLTIRFTNGRPIFFKQVRAGQYFKLFGLIKFRSMIIDADKKGSLITTKEDSRVTEIGRFLRKTKLDELPQLINVVKGEMSFVGPRPEVLKYVELFKNEYNEILKVKPGITDYAAIKFRYEEDILKGYDNPEDGYIKEILPQKIKLYKDYISKISFLNDIRLITLTLWRIIKS